MSGMKHDPTPGKKSSQKEYNDSKMSVPMAPQGIPDGIPRGTVDRSKGRMTKATVNIERERHPNPRRSA